MARRVSRPLEFLLLAATSCLLLAISPQPAIGQIVRPPDFGVWFTTERKPDGTTSLIVTDLVPDGNLAQAGLREGDRIVSAGGKSIDREQQFVQAFLTNPAVTLIVARGGQQYSLLLKSASLMDAMVPLDPYYQTGFLIDEQDPQRTPERTKVQRVFPATLAFYAGLKPGDVITSLNDHPLAAPTDLTKALRRGGRLNLLVTRNNQPRNITLMIPTPSTRLRAATTTGPLSPGSAQPPPASTYNIPWAPLLAPPSIPSPMPAIPSPPPAIPSLPPPGAVPGGT
jgi:membrane-associated protease RseP (regulator of RpoE activity)